MEFLFVGSTDADYIYLSPPILNYEYISYYSILSPMQEINFTMAND